MPSVLQDTTKPGWTEADDYRRRLEADLKVAERVHRSMIPANQRRGNLEIVCEFRPMIGVGGDYASVHFQDDQHVVVGICDVAGHGIAGGRCWPVASTASCSIRLHSSATPVSSSTR